MRYKILSGQHGTFAPDGKALTLGPGDEIELTAEQATRIGLYRLQLVTVPAPQAAPEPPSAIAPDHELEELLDSVYATITGGNWRQADQAIRSLTDPTRLREVRALEVEGKNRKGVLRSIDERIDQLEEA